MNKNWISRILQNCFRIIDTIEKNLHFSLKKYSMQPKELKKIAYL